MTKASPFRYFKTSPEIIRLAVMMYVRFPLSLRNVEDLLHERGIDVSHDTVRYWWNRFGPMFASEIRRKRVQQMRAYSKWKWHVDELFVKINGKRHYLWWAVDHEGEVLEAVVTKRRNKRAAAAACGGFIREADIDLMNHDETDIGFPSLKSCFGKLRRNAITCKSATLTYRS